MILSRKITVFQYDFHRFSAKFVVFKHLDVALDDLLPSRSNLSGGVPWNSNSSCSGDCACSDLGDGTVPLVPCRRSPTDRSAAAKRERRLSVGALAATAVPGLHLAAPAAEPGLQKAERRRRAAVGLQWRQPWGGRMARPLSAGPVAPSASSEAADAASMSFLRATADCRSATYLRVFH